VTAKFQAGKEGNIWDLLRITGNVPAEKATESLETIHDALHDNLGGAGFMSKPEIAGV
jgi:hypothetical protein